MLGLWIDELSEERRDRLVKAQDWTWHGFSRARPETYHYSPTETVTFPVGRCLLSQAYKVEKFSDFVAADESMTSTRAHHVFSRFDKLCDRFGLERVVRAIKLRAGAKVEDLPEPDTALVGGVER